MYKDRPGGGIKVNKVVAAMFALGLLLILTSAMMLAVTGGQTAAAQVRVTGPVVETSPATVALAELLIANMEIRAPFAGTVAPMGLDIVPGGWMTVGASVIGLQETSR